MPRRYEKMRDEFIARGMSEKAAKKRAAKIYNATRGEHDPPVTRGHKGKK